MSDANLHVWEWTAERQAAALARMEAYRGTPHIHRRGVPGVGVDCIHLVYEAFVAGGAIPAILLPAYRRDDGFNQHDNYLERHFLFAFHAIRIDGAAQPQEGDAVIFQIKRSVNHCGVFLGGEIWHSAYGSGAYPEPIHQTEHGAQCYVRLTAPGYRNDPRTDPAVRPPKRK